MTEDEAWDVFAAMHDEEKVTPGTRCGKRNVDMSLTEERAIGQLCRRIGEARVKHPTFARNEFEAGEVIESEFRELLQAIVCESRQRQIDEALDVAATAMRFVLGEHLQ